MIKIHWTKFEQKSIGSFISGELPKVVNTGLMSGLPCRGEEGDTVILHFHGCSTFHFSWSTSLVDFSHEDFLSVGSLDLFIISKESFLEILEIEKTL